MDRLKILAYQQNMKESILSVVSDGVLGAYNMSTSPYRLAPLGFGNLLAEGSYQTKYIEGEGYVLLSIDVQRNTYIVNTTNNGFGEHLLYTCLELTKKIPDVYDFDIPQVRQYTDKIIVSGIEYKLTLPAKSRFFPGAEDFVLSAKLPNGSELENYLTAAGFSKWSDNLYYLKI